MTWLIQALGFLASSAFLKPLLTRALIALGFSLVSFTGITIGFNAVWNTASASWSGLPVDVLTVLTMMKIPNALNVIVSAYAGALAVKGLTAAGSLKRAVWRPGQSGDLFGAG
jgi:hypothetical protein